MSEIKNNHLNSILTQGIGKIRRFAISKTNKHYIDIMLKEREGSCKRCGKCCKILFKCPFADYSKSTVECKIYESRFLACRFFPIDKRCLKDVDYECGFTFKSNGNGNRDSNGNKKK
jgi:hypothetical protein